MKIEAKNADGYVAAIPAERRPHVEMLRTLVKKAVPKATEGIVWGMLGYEIAGRPFVCIASQKNYMSLYLCDLNLWPELRAKHAKALSGLKMGKSCINFSHVGELPLDTIAAILREAPKVVVKSGAMPAPGAKSKAAPKSKAKSAAPSKAKRAAKPKAKRATRA